MPRPKSNRPRANYKTPNARRNRDAHSLREHLTRLDEARRLLCALYTREADLLPDPDAGTLTVRLHHGANAANDQAIAKLCEEFHATETVFPRTNPRLVIKMGSV